MVQVVHQVDLLEKALAFHCLTILFTCVSAWNIQHAALLIF
jgi:hypothetical protein